MLCSLYPKASHQWINLSNWRNIWCRQRSGGFLNVTFSIFRRCWGFLNGTALMMWDKCSISNRGCSNYSLFSFTTAWPSVSLHEKQLTRHIEMAHVSNTPEMICAICSATLAGTKASFVSSRSWSNISDQIEILSSVLTCKYLGTWDRSAHCLEQCHRLRLWFMLKTD